MPTSSVFSINVSQIKHITSKEKSVPGEKSKARLTVMAAASAKGEKLPMFVIWKSKNLRCSKNAKHLPFEYKSQKKSWMNSEILIVTVGP